MAIEWDWLKWNRKKVFSLKSFVFIIMVNCLIINYKKKMKFRNTLIVKIKHKNYKRDDKDSSLFASRESEIRKEEIWSNLNELDFCREVQMF